ncbi:hypothetical protein [Roseovarius sp. D0-M9]|uniref:hypothetical protein n=1 Tax=Roseovarius sp. D0-M9 TaxID=3127117 RepID=UPI0030104108
MVQRANANKFHVHFLGPKDLKENFVITKLTKSSHFTTAQPRTETPLEKTNRIVMEIKEQEADERKEKIARLRKARHESEAGNETMTDDAQNLPLKKKT